MSGAHFIAGTRRDAAQDVTAAIDEAVTAAEAAFAVLSEMSSSDRADFLDAAADALEARRDAIEEAGPRETNLPPARIAGELGRTTGQLRLFASHIRDGRHLDLRHDTALPDRAPLPRPDLRLVQRPLGPVAVFGASNFPLAFSVAGGDTASALAAGCPVVVKGHEAHPDTGALAAEALTEAVARCGLPGGTFSMIQGGGAETGAALATHPLIRAVGFTGSLRAGRALYALCAGRAEPIPFFGELGSINPLFVLPAALSARGAAIGAAWAGSLTMGAGQFCTNPGLMILPEGDDGAALLSAAVAALDAGAPHPMLTPGIAEAYAEGARRLSGAAGVETLVGGDDAQAPVLAVTDAATFLNDPTLQEEVFGPAALVVRCAPEAMADLAANLHGQLTCTFQMDADDVPLAAALRPVLERKAGRLLANGFPTGVEVADAMVHGGPWPATTNFGHTSVGTLAIRRWLRPVCYQDLPQDMLPQDARG